MKIRKFLNCWGILLFLYGLYANLFAAEVRFTNDQWEDITECYGVRGAFVEVQEDSAADAPDTVIVLLTSTFGDSERIVLDKALVSAGKIIYRSRCFVGDDDYSDFPIRPGASKYIELAWFNAVVEVKLDGDTITAFYFPFRQQEPVTDEVATRELSWLESPISEVWFEAKSQGYFNFIGEMIEICAREEHRLSPAPDFISIIVTSDLGDSEELSFPRSTDACDTYWNYCGKVPTRGAKAPVIGNAVLEVNTEGDSIRVFYESFLCVGLRDCTFIKASTGIPVRTWGEIKARYK